jgi:hypothetical protein
MRLGDIKVTGSSAGAVHHWRTLAHTIFLHIYNYLPDIFQMYFNAFLPHFGQGVPGGSA